MHEVREIAKVLDQRFGVDAMWIFGSQAAGRARADSDLDLAALFRRAPERAQLLEARAEASVIAGREVDLVDLGRASPILAMQVLRHGRLVMDQDPSRRIRFVAGAPGRCEDVLRTRRPIESLLLERVAHGRA